MYKNSDVIFYNLIGAGKNGKTLLGSLIDNHPSISTFPMEMKFIEFSFNNLRNLNFHNLKNYLINESKFIFLNSKSEKNNTGEKYYDREYKRLTIGNLEKIKFNKKKYIKIIKKNSTSKIIKSKNLREILIFFHKCLEKSLNKKFKDKIVIQDGLYGMRSIANQIKYLKKIKFIVMVRNPLDVYVISKKTSQNLKFFRRQIGEFAPVENFKVRRRENEYNYFQVNKLFLQYRNNPNFLFIKYEDLVKYPIKKMNEVATFLNVKFSKNLVSPTVFGQKFDCRLNQKKIRKNFYLDEIDQYKKKLKNEEIQYLEIKFQNFLQNFDYVNNKNYSLSFKIINLMKIYILNIFDLYKYIPKKNFLVKYFYCLTIQNNLFFLKNLARLIKTI